MAYDMPSKREVRSPVKWLRTHGNQKIRKDDFWVL